MSLESKTMKNCVSISDDARVDYYYYEKEDSLDTSWMHESFKRKIAEESVFTDPTTELDRVRNMISSWRECDTTVVYGNLGRQPHLINYFLDMCFGYTEEVYVYCRWPLNSHYQVKDFGQESDFMFLIEPPFGHTILKPESVKHLVVLTSHLSLNFTNKNMKYDFLHLSSFKRYSSPIRDLAEGTLFNPPIFHGSESVPEGPYFLDVRRSKCANEAYLRLLTGKEMIKGGDFKILIDERDRQVVKSNLSETKSILKVLGDKHWMYKFYLDI